MGAAARAIEGLPARGKAHERARSSLLASHVAAERYTQEVGPQRLAEVLREAVEDLTLRLNRQILLGAGETFTVNQIRVALAQVTHVLASIVAPGMRTAVVDVSGQAARAAAQATVDYLELADKAFLGVAQPLGLDTARMLDRSASGAEASVLRRLSGDPLHPARRGILSRYGVQTVGYFEDELRKGMVAKKPWGEMRDDLTKRSPFLQGAPRYWAERIVRTEVAGAHGRAQLESAKDAHEQLGDVVKIVSSTVDDRTGSDSIAIHGQVRRVGESFASWNGAFDAPPDRPNDRAVLVTHRVAWGPPPAHLQPKPWDAVVARWKREKRRGSPPALPLMSTVSFARAK